VRVLRRHETRHYCRLSDTLEKREVPPRTQVFSPANYLTDFNETSYGGSALLLIEWI
jgi:hypothetical protein